MIKVWENGDAHWVNVIGYDEPSDFLYYMDPDPKWSDMASVDKVKFQK